MYFVYILESLNNPLKHYVGFSENLAERLKAHNEGKTKYGRIYRPWKIKTFISFENKSTALHFERYLKSGSGHAFLTKRLI